MTRLVMSYIFAITYKYIVYIIVYYILLLYYILHIIVLTMKIHNSAKHLFFYNFLFE